MRRVVVVLVWLLAIVHCVGRAVCPAYHGTISAPHSWEYLEDLDIWNPNDVTTRLMNDLKHQFLDGRKVSVFNCSVPVDNIDCHHDNLIGPTALVLGSPLPILNASVDFECFQGLMSSSRVVAVDLPATNGSSFDGNFTVRFSDLRATFTVHASMAGAQIPVGLGPISVPIPLPPINDEEPVQLDHMSVTAIFPLKGECNETARRFHMQLGKLDVSELELGVEDIHPLSKALTGPIEQVCGKLGPDLCKGIIEKIDQAASGTLERKLAQILPALVSNELSSVLQGVVADAKVHCLPKSVEHVVSAVSGLEGGGSAAKELGIIVTIAIVVILFLVGLCIAALIRFKDYSRSLRICAYSDVLKSFETLDSSDPQRVV